MVELVSERDPARALLLIEEICRVSSDALEAALMELFAARGGIAMPVSHSDKLVKPYVEQLREHLLRSWTERSFRDLSVLIRAEADAAFHAEFAARKANAPTATAPEAIGDPCPTCGKPLKGVLDYDNAGTLMKYPICLTCDARHPGKKP
jgi:hypothetical protein